MLDDEVNPYKRLLWNFSNERWESILQVCGVLGPITLAFAVGRKVEAALGTELGSILGFGVLFGSAYYLPLLFATRLADRDVRIASSARYFPNWEPPVTVPPIDAPPNDDIVDDFTRYQSTNLPGGFKLWTKVGKDKAWASLPDLIDAQPAPFWYADLYSKCVIPIIRGDECQGELWSTCLTDLRVMFAKAILEYPDEKQVFDHASPAAILRHLDVLRNDRIEKFRARK